MIKIMDECCDCANGAYPCQGESCEKRHVRHLICDQCNADVEKLYEANGRQLCKSCLKAHFGDNRNSHFDVITTNHLSKERK